jgi:hypothetical protein
VFTELDINPQRAKQKPRDIPLYKKANWENIKEDLKSIQNTVNTILLSPLCPDFLERLYHLSLFLMSLLMSDVIHGHPFFFPPSGFYWYIAFNAFLKASTNSPSSFGRVETMPRLSDHDIVFTELDINPQRAKQKPRDIPLYKKANWENIKEDLKSIKITVNEEQQ